jgi:glycosyltransferase involved in cell wall biosynthesis
LLKFIWSHTDAFATYGEHGKRFLIGNGIPEEKIFVAWQVVDNSLFEREVSAEEKEILRKRLDVVGKKVLLYVGQLIPVKGLEYLIDAYRRMKNPDTALVIVGQGPLENDLRERSRDLTGVKFAGYCDQENLVAYYSIASVLVLPSVTLPQVKEAWGLVVNEAMNQGCPAVVTDAVGAGVGGLVVDKVNGFVVPERNADALANSIEKILQDPSREATMRNNAKETIRSWDFGKWAAGMIDAINYSMRNAN